MSRDGVKELRTTHCPVPIFADIRIILTFPQRFWLPNWKTIQDRCQRDRSKIVAKGTGQIAGNRSCRRGDVEGRGQRVANHALPRDHLRRYPYFSSDFSPALLAPHLLTCPQRFWLPNWKSKDSRDGSNSRRQRDRSWRRPLRALPKRQIK
jgi:hypothetical protein